MPPEHTDHGDARNLSDRELLLRTHDLVLDTRRAIYGNGQPGLLARMERIETQVEERTAPSGPSKTGMAGLLASVGIILYEVLKVKGS